MIDPPIVARMQKNFENYSIGEQVFLDATVLGISYQNMYIRFLLVQA
jgi:hypothetical protein